jgi:hypothetical protein
MDAAKNKREARMRRAILRILNEARPSPQRGVKIAEILLGASPDAVEHLEDFLDDDRAAFDHEIVRLCQDLVSLGMATVQDLRTLRTQARTIDWLTYTITARGTGLLAGTEPVNGLIEDERRA